MNDDFLYRLRTEPPEHFAAQLKERLDRTSKRSARAWRFGLGVLLFGTAFAMVSPGVRMSVGEVIDWIRGAPAPVADAKHSVIGLARTSGTRAAAPAGPTTSNEAPNVAVEEPVREGVRALLEEMQAARRLGVVGMANQASSGEDSVDNDAGTRTGGASDAFAGGDAGEQSDFIVTGPLPYEYGTPAQMFATRRGYFTLMSWYMKPLEHMLVTGAPFSRQLAQTSVRGLEVLAPMLPELFATDERGSTVPTRAERRIWDQPVEFEREMSRFILGLRVLDVSLMSDEQKIKERIALVRAMCMSCHEKFRKQGDQDVGAVTP